MTSYATNLQFAQRSGFGTRIVDEAVGTGDNSTNAFDLDHTNVITGSYVLSYAASGSHSFTALTETTHYTVDKESGRIALTATGVTVLSTNILYATYWYVDAFSDTVVTDLLAAAQHEVEDGTGRKWSGNNAAVEYLDGRETSTYPTTDQPYMADWDEPDTFMLSNYPVRSIKNVFFLQEAPQVSRCFNYDSSEATYTDKTSVVNDSTQTPFTIFAAIPAANDCLYVGCTDRFLGIQTTLQTLGVGTPTLTWEYYNGSAWTALTVTETETDSSTFEASGRFTWDMPYGWAQNSVNGYTHYWVRGRLSSGSYTTAPILSTIALQDCLSTVLEPRQISFETNGEVEVLGTRIPNGTRNIRIDYYYGAATVRTDIEDLCILYAALRGAVMITGGAYDDATSYSLGSKSVTIGEAWVNIREVIDQLKKRIEALQDGIGRRVDLVAI